MDAPVAPPTRQSMASRTDQEPAGQLDVEQNSQATLRLTESARKSGRRTLKPASIDSSSSLQFDNGKVSVALKVSHAESQPRILPLYRSRERKGARRISWPLRSRLEARFGIRWPSPFVDLVRRLPAQPLVRTVQLKPENIRTQLTPHGITAKRDRDTL